MARPAVLSHKIVEGKVNVFKRKTSPVWQCRFTIGNCVIRKSTNQVDFEKAKEEAAELYITARVRHKDGTPVVSKTFKSIAELAKKAMQTSLKNGTGKVSFNDYVECIDLWLIPFFGSKFITSIDHSALVEFDQWRQQKLGRVPAASTVSNHNIALNRVFDAAVERAYLTRSQVPETINNGIVSERRPDFTFKEYRALYEYMRWKWVTKGRKGLITTKRQVLRDYIFILSNTGIRPGTETKGLQWKHIRTFLKDRIEYVGITVDGKTGKREVICRHGITRYLRRLMARQKVFADKTLAEVLAMKSDKYVFAQSDGTEIANFAAPFKVLLKESGLLVDPRSGQDRTLYSFRHFYITAALRRGTQHFTIASNCGTSIQMIQAHYAHVQNEMLAKELAGRLRKD
jgi:hypothetical protein